MESADSTTAAALQSKLAEVTKRFDSLSQQQQVKENALKDLLPKIEQFEQLSAKLKQFTESRGRLLASGNQPDHDIAHFSQQIQVRNCWLLKSPGVGSRSPHALLCFQKAPCSP